MNQKLISNLLLLVSFLVLTSCSKDNEEKEIVVELTVSSQSVTLDDNNKAVVSVSSNTSWAASVSDSWLSCTPTDGKNNQKITISANGDNTSNAARTGTVTIKDNSGKKSINISVKQNVVLAPLDVVTDLMVPFTDGVAINIRYGKDVVSWYFSVLTKDFASSASDSEIINHMGLYNSPILEKYAIYTSHNVQNDNWYVPDTEYCICTVGVDSSGKYGNLARRLFKTNAQNLPLAEITKIELTSNNQWHARASLKNGASKFYALSSQSVEICNLDDHLIGFISYKDIIETDVPITSNTEGYFDFLNNQIVVCTWATNSTGKIGNCYVARSGSSKSRSNAGTDVTYISSEICPQMLGEMYTDDIYEKWKK